MAELSEAINLDEIAVGLPSRIHEVTARQVAKAPDWIAPIEGGTSWSYRDLERRVSEIATVLSSLGIRAGDRMIIVSENCIALAALLLATSRLDAWAIVASPRLSARELDQIRDHSGARRMFFTSGISKEAAAHASRYGAESRQIDLTSYKRPSQIIILDALPATSAGKILKHKLAEFLRGEMPPAQLIPLSRQQT